MSEHSSRIDDQELAWDMAHAEHPIRDNALKTAEAAAEQVRQRIEKEKPPTHESVKEVESGREVAVLFEAFQDVKVELENLMNNDDFRKVTKNWMLPDLSSHAENIDSFIKDEQLLETAKKEKEVSRDMMRKLMDDSRAHSALTGVIRISGFISEYAGLYRSPDSPKIHHSGEKLESEAMVRVNENCQSFVEAVNRLKLAYNHAGIKIHDLRFLEKLEDLKRRTGLNDSDLNISPYAPAFQQSREVQAVVDLNRDNGRLADVSLIGFSIDKFPEFNSPSTISAWWR